MKIDLKKILPTVLMYLNILIVIALLSMSFVMFYFSSTNAGVFFDHTAMLYTTYDKNDNEKHSLYIVKTDDVKVNVGDEIAFMRYNESWELVPTVDTVVNITDGIAELETSPQMFDIQSDSFVGRVTTKYPALGESLYSFITSKGAMSMYVVFGGGFVVLSLVVILLFAMKTKRDAWQDSESRFDETDETAELDELVIENEHELLTVTDDVFESNEDTQEILLNMQLTNEIEPVKQSSDDILSTEDKVEDEKQADEINSYLDEIIKNAQLEFEKTYLGK